MVFLACGESLRRCQNPKKRFLRLKVSLRVSLVQVHATMQNYVSTLVTAFPDDLGSALVEESFVCVHSAEEVEEALVNLLSASQSEDGRSELLSICAPEKLAVPTWRVCRWWCDDAGGVREVTVDNSPEGESAERPADNSDEAQASSGVLGSAAFT